MSDDILWRQVTRPPYGSRNVLAVWEDSDAVGIAYYSDTYGWEAAWESVRDFVPPILWADFPEYPRVLVQRLKNRNK